MKHIITTLLTLAILLSNAIAQDILVDQGGNETEVIVKRIGQTEVEYIKFDNIDGPLFAIPKTRIFMIKFANGTKEVFGKPSSAVQRNRPGYKERNRFTIEPAPVAKRKSVAGAVILSMFFPGSGQLYTNSKAIGGAMMGVDVMSMAFMAIGGIQDYDYEYDSYTYYNGVSYSTDYSYDYYSYPLSPGLQAAGFSFFLMNRFYSMIDAGVRAGRVNRGEWMYGMDKKVQIAPTGIVDGQGNMVPGANLSVSF